MHCACHIQPISNRPVFSNRPNFPPFSLFGIESALLFIGYYLSSTTYWFHCHWRLLPYVLSICLHLGTEHLIVDENIYFYLTIASAVLASLSLALISYFPVYPKTLLLGLYHNIGTTSFHCTYDDEILSVQCWFPLSHAASGPNTSILWTSGCPNQQQVEMFELIRQLSRLNKVPEYMLSHLALVRTNANFYPQMIVPEVGKDRQLNWVWNDLI